MYLNKTYIAVGSNIGDWKINFNQALKHLSKYGIITKLSSTYVSYPYGFKNQKNFFNSVIEFQTNETPYNLLQKIELIEKIMMKNKTIKNGPRRIDLDIIFYNKLNLSEKKLKIPHSQAHLRDFVLMPLIEINPHFIHPVKKRSLINLYKDLDKKYVFKVIKRQIGSLANY
ncbi:MAG: Bifunctional folate synthesis protein [Alphaproteobacteria bacterium MarineAlpha5_Bin9]|nr:MAG: Bifunctional folate synthesis protein [Alphaproteobacteria bacterium MarineAlpha5_Bin9]